MELIDLTSKLPFAKSVGRRQLATIEYGILHHDAILATDSYDALARYKSEARYHVGKGWGHLSYHLKVGRDGKVYQTLPFEEVGYHAGNYKVNIRGIGICFDGDFSQQLMSCEQHKVFKELLDYLATQRPDMPKLVKKSFFGHRQVRFSPTYCPGDEILNALNLYKR